MKKVDLLYEGKAKKVYTTEDPDILIVDYKDDATAMDGLKKGTIVGKGAINNRMTNHIFKLLEKEGIPTHYVEELSDRETAVKNRSFGGHHPEYHCRQLCKKDGCGRGHRVQAPHSGVQL